MKKILTFIFAIAAIFALSNVSAADNIKPTKVYHSNVYVETPADYAFLCSDINTVNITKVRDSVGTHKEITFFTSNCERYVFIYDSKRSSKHEIHGTLKPYIEPTNNTISYKGSITYTDSYIEMYIDVYKNGVYCETYHTIGKG
jgi:hypothetical protein